MIKKVTFTFVFVLFLLIFMGVSVNAETIADYNSKVAALQKEKAEDNKKSADVQNKIDNNKAKITETTNKIEAAKKDQENTRKEIEQLDKEIKEKKEEIKDILVFYQASENDNFYLKFIFGADSFEDLIYRFSVAEQLTEANDNLVSEMKELVKKNEEEIKKLEQEQQELNKLNKDLSEQINKLGSEKRKINENSLSVDEEIAVLNKQIKYYKDMGCSDNEDVDVCSKPKESSSSSSSSYTYSGKISAKGFQLPLSYGYITSYYGGRIHPIFGVASYHDGIDIAANSGTPVVASNSGEVVHTGWLGGFGNAVMIYHKSCNCTTLYGHLSSISVSAHTYIKRGQKLGEVGSTGVSTGPHLHFQAMYGKGYGTSFDPMNLVSIPLSW